MATDPNEKSYQMGSYSGTVVPPVSIGYAPTMSAYTRDETRKWYLYQVGSTGYQDILEIRDSNILILINNKDAVIGLRLDPSVILRPLNKLYLWSPEQDTLIPLGNVNIRGEFLHCTNIWDGYSATQYATHNLPYVARDFKLTKLTKPPKFKSGQEALDWLERES